MKLLVIVLCLLSERFLIHGISYQRFSWLDVYCTQICELTSGQKFFVNPWIRLIAVILPIISLVSLGYFLLQGLIFGFAGLILSIIIFFYCLGPQNPFYPLVETDSDIQNNANIGAYFASVNSQLFAVLFWYLLGGPIAALTYRLVSLSGRVESISQEANLLTGFLDWVPARLTVLLFLLVGNFQVGFSSFLNYLWSKPSSNSQMLSECGLQAAQAKTSDEEVPMAVAERLVEYAVIVWLVLIALLILGTSI